MGFGLAGHDEVHLLVQQELTQGLMAVQVIGQYRQLPLPKPLSIAVHPTFDRLLFTVLLVVPILRHDELRCQSKDVLVSRNATRDQPLLPPHAIPARP